MSSTTGPDINESYSYDYTTMIVVPGSSQPAPGALMLDRLIVFAIDWRVYELKQDLTEWRLMTEIKDSITNIQEPYWGAAFFYP